MLIFKTVLTPLFFAHGCYFSLIYSNRNTRVPWMKMWWQCFQDCSQAYESFSGMQTEQGGAWGLKQLLDRFPTSLLQALPLFHPSLRKWLTPLVLASHLSFLLPELLPQISPSTWLTPTHSSGLLTSSSLIRLPLIQLSPLFQVSPVTVQFILWLIEIILLIILQLKCMIIYL